MSASLTQDRPAPGAEKVHPQHVLWVRLGAEALGTFVLVFGVVGTAIFGAGFDRGSGNLNDGFLGVAIALGLAVVGAAYALGPISGGHFNPAVTLGLAAAARFPWRSTGGYIAAQVIGGALASTVLFAVAAGGPGGFLASAQHAGFAATGWGELSPGGFPLSSVFLIEFVATAVFVAVFLGATGPRGSSVMAPLAIGLTLTLVALVAIPISNGSFNPARSIASAIYGGPLAVEQLWLSLIAPTLGAVTAGLISRAVRTRS